MIDCLRPLPVLLVSLGIATSAFAQMWKPAPGPLFTPWAKDVSPQKALPEYPRPLMVRQQWQNLNGLWEYIVTPREVTEVPKKFAGQILVPYPIESALSGVMKPFLPTQRLWYRRTFTVPAEWNERVLLHFGAVDWDAEVWVNGRSLGTHRGGYDSFSFDITKDLSPSGRNEIVVGVTDPTTEGWQLKGKQNLHPAGASYTATSGIWQTVWLEPVPKSSIESLKIVTDPKTGSVKLGVTGRTPPGQTKIVATAFDGNQAVAKAEGVFGGELRPYIMENLAWFKATEIFVMSDLEMLISNPKLWSPDQPFLYDLEVALQDNDGNIIDKVRGYFGVRSITKGVDEKGNIRPMLNGEPILFIGALDQGFWPDGIYTAPTDEALRFDVEAAKKLGLNCVRKHIKMEPQRYYYWADKLGLMILQDMPSGNQGDPQTDRPKSPEAASTCEMEMRRLIEQNWNHPSIVMWEMFNEGWGQYDTLRIAKMAKELDPTRLIAEASGFPHHGGGDVYDVHGGIPPKTDNMVGIDSETSGSGIIVPGHQWPGKAWATGTFDPATGGETDKPFPDLFPMNDAAKEWYTGTARQLYRSAWGDYESSGNSGMFKVQLYDLETESNGMLTYDRAVWKVNPETVARAARGSKIREDVTYLLPTSAVGEATWRYTTTAPDKNWSAANFDDSKWSQGASSFGGAPTGGRSHTEWNTEDIWIRTVVTLDKKPEAPFIRAAHDEGLEIYINGLPAARSSGVLNIYDDFEIDPKAAATLRPGKNVIAVRCHQTTGGQFVDVGLVDHGKAP